MSELEENLGARSKVAHEGRMQQIPVRPEHGK